MGFWLIAALFSILVPLSTTLENAAFELLPKPKPATQHDCGIEDFRTDEKNQLYSGWRYVYTAHADPVHFYEKNSRGIKDVFGTQESWQDVDIDAAVTVVGSMSGINMLRHVKPRALLFFDINPESLIYAKLFTDILNISSSRLDFISRMFGRALDSTSLKRNALPQEEQLDAPLINGAHLGMQICSMPRKLPISAPDALSNPAAPPASTHVVPCRHSRKAATRYGMFLPVLPEFLHAAEGHVKNTAGKFSLCLRAEHP